MHLFLYLSTDLPGFEFGLVYKYDPQREPCVSLSLRITVLENSTEQNVLVAN